MFKSQKLVRSAETMPLKEALDLLLEQYQLKNRFKTANLVSRWEEFAGKIVARHTRRIFVSNQKLYLEITSAPLKNEILLAKNEILKRIATEMGEKIVDEIVFL